MSSSDRTRRFEIIHWFNHLHFLDPWQSFRRKLWTSTYLSLESYLPTSKCCWCREFVKMKIRNLHSLLVCPIILWKSSLLRSNEFLADGPDWHLGSKVVSGFWCSLVICGDVSSVTLEIQDWTLLDKVTKKTLVDLQKVSRYTMRVPNVWRLIVAAQHSHRTA